MLRFDSRDKLGDLPNYLKQHPLYSQINLLVVNIAISHKLFPDVEVALPAITSTIVFVF